MNCAKCGQSVPEDAIYCPHCAGQAPVGERAVLRAGLKWGGIAFALGLLPALALLGIYGAERGSKALAFIIPVTTFTTGLIIGMVKAKWK